MLIILVYCPRYQFNLLCVVDINECVTQVGLCQNGRCVNQVGNFSCQCQSGYMVSRDGRSCQGQTLSLYNSFILLVYCGIVKLQVVFPSSLPTSVQTINSINCFVFCLLVNFVLAIPPPPL